MIHVDKNTRIPSVDETLKILSMHNKMMPIFLDFDKLHQYLGSLLLDSQDIEGPLFDVIGYSDNSMNSLMQTMQNFISGRGYSNLFRRNSKGISLDKPSVTGAFETGMMDEGSKSVVLAYQRYTNYKKTIRTLMGLLQLPISDLLSVDNHRMLICHPNMAPQNTGRIAYLDPALQNLPRGLQDLTTVPKGWVRLHCDSGQIEPRSVYSSFLPDEQIIKLINLYDDAYFGVLHYATMPMEHITSKRMEFTPMEITEELKVGRKSIKTHNNAVMYGSTSNVGNDPSKAALIERIGKHPLRMAKINDLQDKINHGERVFRTYFGTPINILNSKKLTDEMSAEEENYELLKLAINNPIQGTAADLMRVSVSEANRLLSLKASKSYITMYIHDAGVFAIHEDDYDKVADELADIVAYDVPGWIPIKAEAVFGRDEGMFEDLY